MRGIGVSAVAVLVVLAMPWRAGAQTAEGTVLSVVPSHSDSWTVGFDGTYLYSVDLDVAQTLIQLDTQGNGIDEIGMSGCQVPLSSGVANVIAWDPVRQVFWGGLFGGVTQISPQQASPNCTFWFDAAPTIGGGGGDTRGLAYDPTDDSLWYVEDGISTLWHFDIPSAPGDPILLGSFNPVLPACAGKLTGVATGASNVLYVTVAGCSEILRYDKGTGQPLAPASIPVSGPAFGMQDLECDPVTFVGQDTDAVWIADRLSEELVAVAVAKGTCAFPGVGPVFVDYKPGTCNDKFKTSKQGEFLSLVGTTSFDVTHVDPASVKVEGVVPLSSQLADVSTPGQCAQAADGIVDLLMRIDVQAVAAAMVPPPVDGESRTLTVTGSLFGGTPFAGEDTVQIEMKKAK
jgi:hypothetical protein